MRRRSRRKKNISLYWIIITFFILIFAIGIVYAQVSQTLVFTGTVRIGDKQTKAVQDVNIESEGYIVESDTRIRYNYTYTINNNTNQPINDWKVLITNMPTTSQEIAEWNHVIYENDIENGRIIFQGKEWNVNIPAGNSLAVHFSFIASELIDVDQLKINLYNDNKTEVVTSNIDEDQESIDLVSKPENLIMQTNAISENEVTNTRNVEEQSKTVTNTTKNPNITFLVTANWENSIQFKITINNTSLEAIERCSFKLGMPEGSSYRIWSSNTTNSANTIICTQTIAANASYDIYGQVDIPEGYNASEYLETVISAIQIQ